MGFSGQNSPGHSVAKARIISYKTLIKEQNLISILALSPSRPGAPGAAAVPSLIGYHHVSQDASNPTAGQMICSQMYNQHDRTMHLSSRQQSSSLCSVLQLLSVPALFTFLQDTAAALSALCPALLLPTTHTHTELRVKAQIGHIHKSASPSVTVCLILLHRDLWGSQEVCVGTLCKTNRNKTWFQKSTS